ncbi:MAG: fibronectin type III domain-containing protein, partial [Candidatus Pacebacteria bacterium]|nr:fibronectin type III domain-containing protein [Candidatus Paceibacterota bacterium]
KIFLLILLITIVSVWLGGVPTYVQGTAMLSWNGVSDSNISGYKIYYGTEPRNGNCPPGGYAQNINVGKNTRYTLKNLALGKTYYFSVTSYDSSGKESCFSKEMKKAIAPSFFDRFRNLFLKKK